MSQETWDYTEGRLLALRRAQSQDKKADITLILINGTPDMHVFQLPQPVVAWRVRSDSAKPGASERPWTESSIEVEGHSVVLLAAAVRLESP